MLKFAADDSLKIIAFVQNQMILDDSYEMCNHICLGNKEIAHKFVICYNRDWRFKS